MTRFSRKPYRWIIDDAEIRLHTERTADWIGDKVHGIQIDIGGRGSLIWVVGIVIGWVMWFRTFHLDKTFCADRFPATSSAVYIRWIELLLGISGKERYEKTDGTFDGAAIDNCFEGFAAGGHDSG